MAKADNWIKVFEAWPYQPEQGPISPLASLSHQEACTNLLCSSAREQTEEIRATIPLASRINTTITETTENEKK